MILYHGTDAAGAAGIGDHRFGVSHVRDSAGCTWFNEDREECLVLSGRQVEWLVIVELPDGIVKAYRYRFNDGSSYLGNFCIPWDVVNEYQPFRYERIQ